MQPIVALIELVISIGLINAPTAKLAAIGSILLLLAFSVYLLPVFRTSEPSACGCFGSAKIPLFSLRPLTRNAVLAALAVISGANSNFLTTWDTRLLPFLAPITVLILGLLAQTARPRERSSDEANSSQETTLSWRSLALPVSGGGVIRTSDFDVSQLLILCLHGGCEQCLALADLAANWVSEDAASLIAAPQGFPDKWDSGSLVVAVDQAFDAGRVIGAWLAPAAFVAPTEPSGDSLLIQGHSEIGSFLTSAIQGASGNSTRSPVRVR